MKKYLICLLMLYFYCSCGVQHFEDVDPLPERKFNKPMTVTAIEDDTATLYTEEFEVEYLVDSEGLKVGDKKYFMLYVWHCDDCRVFRATIYKTFEIGQEKQYRRALHEQHLHF